MKTSPPAALPQLASHPAPRRPRSARGQGARLAEDIVTAALELIEQHGSAEAVTLRAVARQAGIAAPSIYPHFADRDAILLAVVVRVFDELAAAASSCWTTKDTRTTRVRSIGATCPF